MEAGLQRSYIYMIQTSESRYNQWVREHYRFLLRSAWGLTGSRAIAEDVVQDCFTSAWQYRSQLRQPELARAWLFKIMRRHILRHAVPGVFSLQENEGLDMAEPNPAASSLDDQLDVVQALARIAPIHREVLVLFYFDDMPTAQMAEALDIAPGTVLSRLSRAREALKAALAGPARAPAQPAAAPTAPRLRKV